MGPKWKESAPGKVELGKTDLFQKTTGPELQRALFSFIFQVGSGGLHLLCSALPPGSALSWVSELGPGPSKIRT